MKIQLIHAKHELAGEIPKGFPQPKPPIGLEIIAKVIESSRKDVRVEILDGEIISEDRLLKMIDADYVGLSSWFSNHRCALKIGKIAKEKGATVVFGGPNATHLAKNILRNNSFVDYVIAGDGEYALLKLISGYKMNEVENLFYRDGSKIKFTFGRRVDLNSLPPFDLEHTVCNEKYFEKDRGSPFPISSIRGCIKAVRQGRCSFCSLHMKGLRLMNPKRVWKQIKLLKENYDIDYFFETGDCFIVGNYPQKLLANRPEDLKNIYFRIFERPNTINEQNIKVLKKLNVREVFIGVEHVDKSILKRANKLYDVNIFRKELNLLEKYGINAVISIVFGLPGESVATAESNYRFVKEIVEQHNNISGLGVSIALPLAGSTLYYQLMSDTRILEEYKLVHGRSPADEDLPDYNLLTQLMIKYYCDISIECLIEIVRETKMIMEDRAASLGNILDQLEKGVCHVP
ncbi:MAG: hypothetical protein DRN00_03165 [Thermoplasmata archaeon]|nr:MAG: hypothetical protein DRN00_03165 [Thermoplasmata archaeon]